MHAPQSVCTQRRHERSSHALWGTRPSLGPSTCACRSSLCTAVKATVVGRSIRHHGWASPRKWEEPALGSGRTDIALLAACHRFRKGEAWHVEKRKEVKASVPARTRSSGLVARTSIVTLQKSVGDVWPRISSAYALQKERSGSSERGPSSERGSAGETVGHHVG